MNASEGIPEIPSGEAEVESVQFTGTALEFLKKQAGAQGKSIEDIVSSAVGTYAYLKGQVADQAKVMVEKAGKRSKIDI